MTLFSTATAPEQAPAPPRPYQGVRVKEPVKELLRRKRGHASSGAAVTPTAVRTPLWPQRECVYGEGVGQERTSPPHGTLAGAQGPHIAMVMAVAEWTWGRTNW